MANKDLLIDIKANTKNYVKGVKKVKGENQKLEKSMKKMLSYERFQAGVMGFRMMSGAVKSLFNQVKRYVQVYETQMANERKLTALMKNRGEYSRKMFSRHLAFAREMQKTSNYGDEQIIELLSQFQTFTNISQKTAQQAAQATANIATTTGQDLTSVGIQLSKALSAPLKMASSLRRSGVMFDTEKLRSFNTLAERQAYLLAEVQKQYGGAAKGGISELKQFENAFGDIEEQIGKNLMPLFRSMKKGMLSVLSVVADLTGWFSKLFSSSTDVGYAFKELNVTMEEYSNEDAKIKASEKLIQKYEDLQAAGKDTTKVMRQIAKSMPQTITAFNEQGEAIAISTKAAKNYNTMLREANQAALRTQMEKTLSESKKTLTFYKAMQADRRLKSGGANIIERTARQIFSGAGQADIESVESRAKYSKEYQKLLKQLPQLESAFMSVDNITKKHIKTLAVLKSGINATKNEVQAMQAMLLMERDNFQKFSKGIAGFAKLAYSAQMKIVKAAKQRAGAAGVLTIDWAQAKKMTEKALKARNKAIKAANQASGIDVWKKQRNSLIAYMDKLDDLHNKTIKTKLQYELDKQSKELLSKLGYLGEKDKARLKILIDLEGQTAMKGLSSFAQKIAKKYNIEYEKAFNLLLNAREQRQQIRSKSVEESMKAAEEFAKVNEGYIAEWKKIEEDKRRLEEKLNKDRERIGEENYKKGMKLLKQGKELAEIKSTSKFIKAFSKTGSDLISEIKNLQKAIQKGSVGGAITGAGNVLGQFSGIMGKVGFEKFGQVGQTIQGIADFVGGFLSMFEGEGISARKIWEENFELLTGRLNYELRQQQEILRMLKKQEQLVNYINKLSGIASDSAERNFLEEMEHQQNLEAFQQASQFQIDGTAIQDMDMEDLINAYQSAQQEMTGIEDLQALAQLYISRINTSEGPGFTGEYSEPTREAWRDFLDIASPYLNQHFWVEEADEALQSFMVETGNIIDMQNTSIDVLEQYADLEAQINQLEEERLENNLKITDELYNQLRALGDQNINKILDQAEQLERDISLGVIREGSAEADRQRALYMNQLMNLLGQTGETGLASDVQLARADYYRGEDLEQFLSRAGQGRIVQLDSGGLITQSGLASVHAGEIIMNKKMMRQLGKQGNVVNLNGGINLNFDSSINPQDAERIGNMVYDSIARKAKRAGVRII